MSKYGEWALAGVLCVFASVGCTRSPTEKFLLAVSEGKGVVPLPKGGLELTAPIVLGPRANGLEITGQPGDVVRAKKGTELRGFFICRECKKVTFRDFSIEGDPDARGRPAEMPPADTNLREYFTGNGIIIEGGQGVTVRQMKFRELSGFAVLTAFDKDTTVEKSEFTDSGTRNSKGHNTGAGGLAFTDGSTGFHVTGNTFKRLFGNGVWVHSIARADRSQNGIIEGNHFENISRDTVLLSRAYKMVIRKNTGRLIGFPTDTVNSDLRPPAAIGTEGKVDGSTIDGNSYEQVNGRCFDLDGFHDGTIANNSCVNRGAAADYPNGGYGLVLDNGSPEMHSQQVNIHDNTIDGMRWGGIFLIGSGHRVVHNRLLRLNLQGCTAATRDADCMPNVDDPLLARSGIYMGLRGLRPDPVEGALVEGNEITGLGMGSGGCVAYAPQVKPTDSTVRGNTCHE